MKFYNFLLLFLISNLVSGQTILKDRVDINNDIKYEVVYKSGEFEKDNSFSISKYLIVVQLSKKERNIIRKLPNKKWKVLLNSENDWAYNLILYDIFEKDASLLIEKKDINSWRLDSKAKELSYWDQTLKDTNVSNYIKKRKW